VLIAIVKGAYALLSDFLHLIAIRV
jgi:hypothetical protein